MNELDKPPDINPDEEDAEILSIRAASGAWYGPIPPPQMLGQYEEVIPGVADRIVKVFERREGHEQEMDRESLKTERIYIEGRLKGARLSTIFSFVAMILIALYGGFVLWVLGEVVAGSTLILVPAGLTGFSYLFEILSRRSRRNGQNGGEV